MEERDELIYKKLSGELTPDEELIFEHRRAVDGAFAEEYDFQRAALAALAHSEEATMKEKLQRAYHSVQRRKRHRRRWGWAGAAVLALLLAAGGWWWYQRTTAPPLYEQYFVLYQPYPEVRGATEADRYAETIRFYQRGDFATAATLFGELPRSDRRDLYLGNCYWQLGELTTAQQYFRAVQDSDNDIMRQHADWYQLLGALRQGNQSRVETLLPNILAEEGLYYKEARQLLADLKAQD